MNKEEFKECSVVAYPRQIKFLHINGGAISYYVDRHVSDYVDRLQKENQQLKKQLDYLRSGEYYNQLRFENEMLQQVVDTNGVPSEVYDYIDCTHRNTELLEENQKYKEVIDKVNNKLSQYKNDLKEYQEQDRINHQNISIGLVGVKIRAFEDILKEVE